VSTKPTKTKEQLSSLITDWLKGRPECVGVTDVAVAPMVRISDDSPNWHAAFIMAEGDADGMEAAVAGTDRFQGRRGGIRRQCAWDLRPRAAEIAAKQPTAWVLPEISR
jgi:hypothetical protein